MSDNFEYYELDPPKKGDLPQLPPLFKAQEVLNSAEIKSRL